MNRSVAVLLISGLLFSVYSFREEFEFSGDHNLHMSIPLISDNQFSGNVKVPRLESDLTFTGRRGNYTLKTGLSIQTSLIENSQLGEMTEILPLENSLSLSGNRINTTLGFQYFAWGSADKINPTDKLNPRDYTTGPDADKIPVFAASLTYYPTDRLSIQGVYVPFRQPDRYPVDHRDEIPEALFLHDKNITIEEPSFDPSSYTAGGRMRLMSGVFDIGLSYLYDIDEHFSPVVALNTDLVDGFQIFALDTLTLVKERIHRFGFDTRAVVGRFGFWGEAAYSLTGNTDNSSVALRNNHVDWTVGMDFFYGQTEEHYINIQQIGRVVVDYDDSFYEDYPTGEPGFFDYFNPDAMEQYYYRLLTNRLGYQTEGVLIGGAIRGEWSFVNSRVTPSVEALYLYPFMYETNGGKRYGDLLGTAQIEFVPTDAVSIRLGGQGFYSMIKNDDTGKIQNDSENRIGFYFPDSHIFLNVAFSWIR